MSAFVQPAAPHLGTPRPRLSPTNIRRCTFSATAAPSALEMTAGCDAAAASSSLHLAAALPDGLAAVALAAVVAVGLIVYRAISSDTVYPGHEVTSVVVGAASGHKKRPPLLFVHGCAHGGFLFTGLAHELASDGYTSHLLTLPKSKFKSLYEYTADIGSYISNEMEEGPVLVGHSQGGAEVAHYLLNGNMDAPTGKRAVAGVFLAPASVEGSAAISVYLVPRYPWAVVRAALSCNGAESVGINDLEMMKETMFALGTTSTSICGEEETLEAYAARLSPVESCRVLADASFHRMMGWDKTTPAELGIPTLTLAAELDGIIPEEATDAVAARWGNKLLTVRGQGHCFGDPGWEGSAVPPLVAWLDANVPDAAGSAE